ncbi:hypothetical protein [Mycobacteroides immunogenum]|uniref:Secreted protein n=1 Tax=Mycobacteroides immunogenum TaxID=83262 RepID=A0A7V8LRZ1_9MYCO|nr:hypothetical protein [Mycobacteroides immunogenum]AMT70424.1 hypothetical protein ABG82_08875 [Mycobacteroides immunogenum]ANO03492.1 hypothetical protein BAB75_08935 [Mycobacteroides immunogenum]KIU42044.1 hypothetical protein TL11_02715 [Mycobacteroides immunogenum]KPG13512.1 hypothetical protein AN909_04205 [Mycobacteroides immunogenum]KPG14569.1 hypothetical protein AN908_08660 [Mycobacteroides immunogenum]
MNRVHTKCLFLVLALSTLFSGTPVAMADSATAGSDVQVAQSLGGRELTVVARRVTSIPGPLHVDVITHQGTAAGPLRLQLIPTGAGTDEDEPAPGVPTSTAMVALGEKPGPYSATLTVDRTGPADLTISDGVHTARVPLVLMGQAMSPPERVAYLGLASTGLLLVVSLVVATRVRRGIWIALPVTATVVALAVAITGAVLSASAPPPPEPGLLRDPTVDNTANPYQLDRPAVTDYSRPSAMLVAEQPELDSGRTTDVGFSLIDTATGLPVDDLVIHDSALIHLLVVAPDGQLSHLHPIRVAPGSYSVPLSPRLAGRHAVSAEFVRRGGGVQTVRLPGGLTARGGKPAPPAAFDGPGMRMMDGLHVHVSATGLRAGRPTTLSATIGSEPVLQPWLGMLGHLVIAGPIPRHTSASDLGTAVQDSALWAHAHSMGGHGASDMPGMEHGAHHQAVADEAMPPMVGAPPLNGDSPPDETVAAFGPDVPFTFTFPKPGRYLAWIQAQRDYRVLTIPVRLDIS